MTSEQRRWEIDRGNAQTIKSHFIRGKTVVQGTGEAIIPVSFPVVFTEEPTFYFGGVMLDGFDLSGSVFPTISAVVASWTKTTKQGTNIGYLYDGANILAVTTGPSDLQMWVHWTFFGEAMRNPL